MTLTRIVTAAALAVVVATPARAQQVTLNFDDVPTCSGALGTYAGWISIAAGTCKTGPLSNAGPQSPTNYLLSSGGFGSNVDMSFLQGPVVFNGLYTSGHGTFFLELYNGGSLVSSTTFSTMGTSKLVTPGYAGQVDRVKVRLYAGQAVFGVDDITFEGQQQEIAPTPGDSPGDDLVNQPNATPEPATMLLVASGLGGVGALMRRRRKAAGQVE